MKAKSLLLAVLSIIFIEVSGQNELFWMKIKFDNITPIKENGFPGNVLYRGVEHFDVFNPSITFHADMPLVGRDACLTTGYLFSGSLIKLRPNAYSVVSIGIRSGDISAGALAGISRRSSNRGNINPFGASYLNDKVVGMYLYSKEESYFSVSSLFLFEQQSQFIFWKTEVKGALPPYEVISFFETFVGAGFGAGYRMKNHSISLVWSFLPHKFEGTGAPFETIKFSLNSFLM